jgi:predicted GNAT family N-acyltransferase
MPNLHLRSIPLAQTRRLRRDVLRPYMTVDELSTTEPSSAVAYGVFDDDELVAVGLVGPEGEPGDWRIRGMATAPQARGRGAGTKVLQALVQHAVDNGATRLWCNARTPARSLYERAGFIATSDEFETPRIGPHYRMELRADGRDGTG